MSRMSLENPFLQIPGGTILDTVLPDFILSFAFFTSIAYAVLGKRFDRQRPAIAMSAAIGFAFSIGVVWWEYQHDLSIKNLGPLAVGFAVIILALIIYKAVRQVGGSWAGAGIALGASLLVASLIGSVWPIDEQIVQSIMVVGLTVGILAFLLHHGGSHYPHIASYRQTMPDVRHDMSDLYRDRIISDRLDRGMRHLRKETKLLNEHPEEAGNVMLQLQRMLPAEGWLTERMASLRAKAHGIRNGHIARLEETKHVFADMPASEKKKASARLVDEYKKMENIDEKLQKLDTAVAEAEVRIRELIRQAEYLLANYEYKKVPDLIKAAERLQHRNTGLIKLIEGYEKQLSDIARKVVKET